MSAFRPEHLTPAAALLGRRVLEVDGEHGTVRLGFTARSEFLNRHGTVQGGFLAAMLDSATAIAVLATLPDELTAVTTDLHVRYVRPAEPGALAATGRLVARSDAEARTTGELTDADGRVIAHAEATLRILRRR